LPKNEIANCGCVRKKHRSGGRANYIKHKQHVYTVHLKHNSIEEIDTIISTLPLPVLLSLVSESVQFPDDVFKSSVIYTYRAKFPAGFCDVYQTLYYPDTNHPVYRATIDRDEVIVEATKKCTEIILGKVVEDFGIKPPTELDFTERAQKHGKIKPLEEETRRVLLNALTTKYNIYSIGRFALWKNVRADDMYKDALRIRELMRVSEESAQYLLRKERNDKC